MFALTSDMFVVNDGVVTINSVLSNIYETEALCMEAAEGLLTFFQTADVPDSVVSLTVGCTKLVGM